MALPVYSSKEVKVSWIGVPLKGLADGTFVSFSYNADTTSEKVGADGSVEISLSPDNTGTCTLTFLQEAPANLLLSGVMNLIKQGKFFQGALVVTDPSGSVLAFMRSAHIKTAPTVNLGIETENREWTFFIEDLTFTSLPEEISSIIAQSDLDQIAGGIATIADSI